MVDADITRQVTTSSSDRAATGLVQPEECRDGARLSDASGLLNLVGRGGAVRASRAILELSVTGASSAVERLLRSGLVTYRSTSDEFRIWEGSDVDINAATARYEAIAATRSLGALLDELAPLAPVIAAAHSEQTGVLRSFEQRFVEPDTVGLLLTPDCDLMVRGNGRTATDMVLLKIGRRHDDQESHLRLRDKSNGVVWSIEWTDQMVTMPRAVLDLCTFRSDGRANVDRDLTLYGYWTKAYQAFAETQLTKCGAAVQGKPRAKTRSLSVPGVRPGGSSPFDLAGQPMTDVWAPRLVELRQSTSANKGGDEGIDGRPRAIGMRQLQQLITQSTSQPGRPARRSTQHPCSSVASGISRIVRTRFSRYGR